MEINRRKFLASGLASGFAVTSLPSSSWAQLDADHPNYAKLDAVLQPGDRVEIYRPLIADPKEQRKKRAAEGKQLKKRN